MKTSKILMSTFVAAAAMNLPAFAELTQIADMSTLVGAGTLGDDVSNVSSDYLNGATVYDFGGTNGITNITTDFLTSLMSQASGYITVAAWVRHTSTEQDSFFSYGAQSDGFKFDIKNSSLSVTTKGVADKDALGSVAVGEWTLVAVSLDLSKSGDSRYLVGSSDYWTRALGSWNDPADASKVFGIGTGNGNGDREVFSGQIANLTVFSSDAIATSSDIVSAMGSVAPTFDNLVWDGGDIGTWNTTDTVWTRTSDVSASLAFFDGAYVTFSTSNAVITIDGTVAPGGMTVSENTTFNIGESGSLSADSISVSDEKTATLNLASATTLSANLDGAGTLRKTGAGALTYSGTIESGSTLEIASGGTLAVDENGAGTPQDANVFSGTLNNGATLKISDGVVNATGSQKLNGNVVIASGATLYSATTDAVTWSDSTAQTIEVFGTLHLDARWSMGSGKEIVLAGGTITGTGADNGGISGVALDYYDSTGKISVAENTSGSSIEANIAVRSGSTLTFDANSDLSVSGNLISYESGNSVTASGSMSIAKTGAGTLTLSGDNKQASTTISDGKIVAASADALGTGTVTVSGGELEIAVADGGTLTQSSAWTTTGDGKISVSAGTLALTGEVNLASAIEVASGATVTVSENVVFALSGLTRTEGEGGTTYSLVSLAGGATLGMDWTGLSASNLDVSGTTIAGRSLSASFSDTGSVTLSGVAGDIVWNGSDGNSTWDTTSTNWKIDGNADTQFYTNDNVTFNDSASSKTVTLADGSSLEVGTMTVESGDYTLVAESGSASVRGSTLSIESGASLQIGNSSQSTPVVNIGFDSISVAGTLKFENGPQTWSSLSLEDGGELYIIDGPNATPNLTINELTVNGASTIASATNKNLYLKNVSGSGDLAITGNNASVWSGSLSVTIDALNDYSGSMSFSKTATNGGLAVTVGAVLNAANASLDIGSGVTFSLSGGEGLYRLKNLTLGEGVSLTLEYGVGLTYEKMTMKDGSVLNLRNGNGTCRIVGGTDSVLVVDAATTGITINGSLNGNNTNISGVIEGNGKVKFANGTGNNAFTVSADIRDGNGGAISVDLVAGASQSVTFSGANTYSGGTLVTSGTLVAANASALGTGALSIDNSSGTAEVRASVANVELHDTAITFADSTIADAVLTISSDDASFTVVSDATLYLDIGALTDSVLTAGEEVALSIAAANAFGDAFFGTILVGTYEDDAWVSDATWSYKEDSWNAATGTLTLTAIPEPSAFGLLAGLGALALVASRRRRNKR